MSWASAAQRGETAPGESSGAEGDVSALERPVRRVGKYRILSELGRGGMANVYLAVTHGPGGVNKLVVLKALLPDLATEPSALTMFLDEARLAAQLNHANVVQTYEVGTEGDRHVIVMEYLEGQSLSSIMKRAETTNQPLTVAMHLRIIISVLEGLHYAHELSAYDGSPLMLVHRDVSPQNVFVTYGGQVKVLDFGIAKAASSSTHTATGIVKGKISYMAPEQMVADNVDRRADVYSVGCMLWAIAAGRKLWKDTPDVHVMRAVIGGEIPTPQSVNPACDDELNRIIVKALAPERDQRYQSALELQEELEHYCEAYGVPNRQKDVGRYVSNLFADTRAELKALVERQLTLAADDAYTNTTGDFSSRSATRSAGSRDYSQTGSGQSGSGAAAVLVSQAPANNRRWVVVGALAFLFAGGAFAMWPKPVPPPAKPEPIAKPTDASGRAPTPVEFAKVSVRLSAAPAEAHLFIDGEPLGGNPSSQLLAVDGKVHLLRAEAEGYQPATAEFSPTHDDAVELRLEKSDSNSSNNSNNNSNKSSHVGSSHHASAAAKVAATAAAAKSASLPAACAQPFFIDTDGIKKIRPGCF